MTLSFRVKLVLSPERFRKLVGKLTKAKEEMRMN